MDKKLTAILLKASDLKDSDKSVRLFSAEEGVVTAVMHGVRKQKAKLKFASQPFALCRYELNEKSGKYTVTGATPIEDLYSICLEPVSYASACLMLETVDKASASIEPDKLFVVLLKSLKALLLNEVSSALISAKFIQKVLSMSGFVVMPKKNTTSYETPSSLLDYIAYKTLEELRGLSVDRDTEKKAVKLMASRFESVYESRLMSLKIYLTIL